MNKEYTNTYNGRIKDMFDYAGDIENITYIHKGILRLQAEIAQANNEEEAVLFSLLRYTSEKLQEDLELLALAMYSNYKTTGTEEIDKELSK